MKLKKTYSFTIDGATDSHLTKLVDFYNDLYMDEGIQFNRSSFICRLINQAYNRSEFLYKISDNSKDSSDNLLSSSAVPATTITKS